MKNFAVFSPTFACVVTNIQDLEQTVRLCETWITTMLSPSSGHTSFDSSLIRKSLLQAYLWGISIHTSRPRTGFGDISVLYNRTCAAITLWRPLCPEALQDFLPISYLVTWLNNRSIFKQSTRYDDPLVATSEKMHIMKDIDQRHSITIAPNMITSLVKAELQLQTENYGKVKCELCLIQIERNLDANPLIKKITTTKTALQTKICSYLLRRL